MVNQIRHMNIVVYTLKNIKEDRIYTLIHMCNGISTIEVLLIREELCDLFKVLSTTLTAYRQRSVHLITSESTVLPTTISHSTHVLT